MNSHLPIHPSFLRSGFLALAFGTITAIAQEERSEPYTWKNVNIGGGGFVTGIVFHPAQKDLIYSRTDVGGAYRWDPASSRWISITDWIGQPDWELSGIESVAVDPTDPNRVYVAAGIYTAAWAKNGEILRSENQGTTFERVPMPFKMGGNDAGRGNGERLAVDPNDGRILFFGSRTAGLWKSNDHGKSWDQVPAFPAIAKSPAARTSDKWKQPLGISLVLFDPQSGTAGKPTPDIYAGVSTKEGQSLYRSRDAGATWKAIPGQPEGLRPTKAVLAGNGILYVSYGDEPGPNSMTDGAVWKLDTNSGVWTDITPEKPGNQIKFGYGSLAVDPTNPDRIFATTFCRWAGGDRIYLSLNGGTDWTNISPQTRRDSSSVPYLTWGKAQPGLGHWIADIEINPHNTDQVLYTTGATIWSSADATGADTGKETHWVPFTAGFEETVVSDLISPPSGAPLFSALWDIDGFRHEDLDVSPKNGFFSPGYTHCTSIDFAEEDPNILVRVHNPQNGSTGGSFSRDNGVTWQGFPSAPDGFQGKGVIALATDGSSMVWTGEKAAETHVSFDMGKTWAKCQGLPRALPVVSDRVNPKVFHAFDQTEGALYGSSDGGSHFLKIADGVPPSDKSQIQSVPGKSGDLWLAVKDGLYRYEPGEKKFLKVNETITEPHRIGFGKAAPGADYPAIFLCGKINDIYGFHRSDDAGKTWVRINDDHHQFNQIQTLTGDPRIYGRIYIGTRGRGIVYGDIARSTP